MGRAAQKARTYAELAPKEHGRLYVDCLRAQAEVLQDLDRGTEAEQVKSNTVV